ncbi:hypothetical protein MMC26_002190 [Xylographa opegraphella]|nr:hypothetical protein [Xylographa opegraphella]
MQAASYTKCIRPRKHLRFNYSLYEARGSKDDALPITFICSGIQALSPNVIGRDQMRTHMSRKGTSAIKAATPGGVDAALLDAVAAAASQPTNFTAFNSTGPKTYPQVSNGENVEIPKGSRPTAIAGQQISGTKSGMSEMLGLTSLL